MLLQSPLQHHQESCALHVPSALAEGENRNASGLAPWPVLRRRDHRWTSDLPARRSVRATSVQTDMRKTFVVAVYGSEQAWKALDFAAMLVRIPGTESTLA